MKYCENECGKIIPETRKYCSKQCACIWRNRNNQLIKDLSRERTTLRNKTNEQILHSINNIKKVNTDPELILKRDIARTEAASRPEVKERNKTHALNNLNEIAKFRKNHNGRTFYEERLWSSEEFRNLNPQWNKRVYWKSGRFYQLDFSFPEIKLNVELDHNGNGLLAHDEDSDFIRDLYLTSNGWTVLRFKNEELDDLESVVKFIKTTINELKEN